MLRNLSLTTRILLLPLVPAAAFVALVATVQVLNTLSGGSLSRLENTVYPTLVLCQDLEVSLKEVYRGLQDAQTFESFDTLEENATQRQDFEKRLAEGHSVLGEGTATRIGRVFTEFYTLARSTTERYLNGERGDTLLADSGRSKELFDSVQELLAETGETARRQMEQELSATRSRNRTSFAVSLVVSAAALVVLGWFTFGVMKSVRTLAREVTGSAAQINSSSLEVLLTARQQEAAANQHASAIDETRRTIESLVESSRAIAELAEAVLQNAQSSQRTNQEIAERNSHLITRLEGISAILEAVKDIASKSEILALNAALEGTKAGEAGRGFSLVAVQMQRLAENVMDNVKDIKRLTQEIREASHSTVLAIEEGGKLAGQTTRSATEIRLVTQQQESATDQVTQSMGDAALQVQQTVSGIRQSTKAMESLVQLASQLNVLLGELKLSDPAVVRPRNGHGEGEPRFSKERA